MDAPFFIVGSARSGTTLLRMILNAHPQVAVPSESRFVVELYRGERVVDVEGLLTEIAGHRRFQLWELGIDAVRAELPSMPRLPYADIMGATFAAYAHAGGKSRWGDKTPRYVEHMGLLARLWPDSRFVHLVRDGRNVALSYADVPFGPKTVGAAAELWAGRVAKGMAVGASLGADRYLQMRYEDLVEDARGNVETLCRFLDLDFDDKMLTYAERSEADVLERAKHYNPNVIKPPLKEVRSWQKMMPPEQVETFEAVAGDTLLALGYPRRFAAPDGAARLRGALGKHGLPVGRLRSSKDAPVSEEAPFTDDETD